MADRGWVYDEDQQRWQLRNQAGRVVGEVSAYALDRVGRAMFERYRLRLGLPPLPARPGAGVRPGWRAAGRPLVVPRRR